MSTDNKDNKFELTGKIGWISIKYNNETAKPVTTIRLDKKQSNNTYMNLFIKFYNTKNRNTAEILADEVNKDDYIRVTGQITTFKDLNDNQHIQLIGWGYKKVKWDSSTKKFVDI